MAKEISKSDQKKEITAHSEYIADRNKKIDLMFKQLEANPDQLKTFNSDPAAFASKFNLVFNDEEIFAAKTLKSIPVASLRDRLKGNPVALFDNNCGCGGGGGGTQSW
ncbi:hypothetical protein EXU57_24500 [Segetibacter sp. 3557_3]|uniref:hypothetical protein n=1 Tax=Segetibacter sp. 3557_3 TaxID=2547429 RepID=UPI001058B16A|nr:hypothetical protein [Segetibacter sp. 3557_3]TDH18038.1 hypothetical protein EXU57_24500 [Segetibacter sp. 3557_3]